jgi:putative oxygen-independent coproporphyrinogen III oxidase
MLSEHRVQDRPLGLYIHWPFCLAKCPYCDFNSHVSAQVDFARYGDALCQEMTHMASLLSRRTPLASLFFGGGTPSLMPADLVARLIVHAERTFGLTPDVEITAEANPTSVEAAAMLDFRRAGVNRVSMGVQALDDTTLKFLGRMHSVDDALQALDRVRAAFDRVSIDLIYATPDQNAAAWRKTLSRALGLGLSHLSLYQLTIEEGTVFYSRQRRGEVMALDDDRAADLYTVTQDLTTAAGLPAYEISNHAAIGQECRHNLIYWQGSDWIGIGPGAHGRFTRVDPVHGVAVRTATLTRRSPVGWLDAVTQHGHGIERIDDESTDDWATEMVMMGLRLTRGITLGQIEALCGCRKAWLDETGLARAIENGWLVHRPTSGRLYTTATGRLRLNSLLSLILT